MGSEVRFNFFNTAHHADADAVIAQRPDIETVQMRTSRLAENSFSQLSLHFKKGETVLKFPYDTCKINAGTSFDSLVALAAKTKFVAKKLTEGAAENFTQDKAKELMSQSYSYVFEYDDKGEVKAVLMYKYDPVTKKLADKAEKMALTKDEVAHIKKMAAYAPPTPLLELEEVTAPQLVLEESLPLGVNQGHFNTIKAWFENDAEQQITEAVKEAVRGLGVEVPAAGGGDNPKRAFMEKLFDNICRAGSLDDGLPFQVPTLVEDKAAAIIQLQKEIKELMDRRQSGV